MVATAGAVGVCREARGLWWARRPHGGHQRPWSATEGRGEAAGWPWGAVGNPLGRLRIAAGAAGELRRLRGAVGRPWWPSGNLPGRPKVGRPEGARAAGAVRWRRLGQWHGGDS